jgi:acyl-CoA synthetase (NDP forming)
LSKILSSELYKASFWHSLFAADSIAVIGANNNEGSWGYNALKKLISHSPEIKRQVYAVNPNTPKIQGLTAYKSILDIPDPVELAIIVVAGGFVPDVLRQCVQKKVKAAVIISAGFAEIDEAGAKIEAELVNIARRGGIHFVGPNCFGHGDLHSQVLSAGVSDVVKPGSMALLTQSGTIGGSIIETAANMGIGISKFVGTGNEADLHLEDYLEYLAYDVDTSLIAIYLEGLREGRRFFQLAKEITAKKPIVVIKTGGTSGSSKAARSHTGALSGSDIIYNAAFKQTGVIRVEDEQELNDIALALLNQPLPRGNGVGIITMGGGYGVMTAEACEKEGLTIASLEPQTLEKLDAILPPRWPRSNPVDFVGIKLKSEGNAACLNILMEDKNIDAIIAILPPTVGNNLSPDQLQAMQIQNQKDQKILCQLAWQKGKPLLYVRANTGHSYLESSALMPKERIPLYSSPRSAARVMRHLIDYRQYLDNKDK